MKDTNEGCTKANAEPSYVAGDGFADIFRQEMEEWVEAGLDARATRKPPRGKPVDGPDQGQELIGLALSGGGIRSASLALGATQALARYGVLERVDYLSTVSGGGYLGSAISALLHHRAVAAGSGERPASDDKAASRPNPLSKDNFPFAFDPTRKDFKPEAPTVRHIRERSNYLAPRLGFFDTHTWYALLRVLTYLVLLLVVLVLPPVVFLLSLLTAVPPEWWNRSAPFDTPGVVWIPLVLGGTALVVFALATLRSPTLQRTSYSKVYKFLQVVIVGSILFLGLIFGVRGLLFWSREWPIIVAGLVVSFGGSGAVFAFLARWAFTQLGRVGTTQDAGGLSSQARLRAQLLKLLFGVLGYFVLSGMVLLLFLVLDGALQNPQSEGWTKDLGIFLRLLAILTLVMLLWDGIALLITDLVARWPALASWPLVRRLVNTTPLWVLNNWSLHPYYRDSLGDAFMQRDQKPGPQKDPTAHAGLPPWSSYPSDGDGREDFSRQAERRAQPPQDQGKPEGNAHVPLFQLQQPRRRSEQPAPLGPYHIIGTSLNITGNDDIADLNRKSDAFFLAPLYSGSSITGFVRTEKSYPSLGLATAMAISGAAFSPNQGAATNTSLAILMTLLNARLGYWLPSPRLFGPRAEARRARKGRPLRFPTPYYYFKEMFGKASGSDAFVYLTDGGHFDNSGIYELIRRRCRYIIAVDGAAEPSPTEAQFALLGEVSRLVRIDFGVDIEIDLRPLQPDAQGRTDAHYAVGRIVYPKVNRKEWTEEDAQQDRYGTLVYLKASLTRDSVPPDLEFYHRMNPSFPTQSTIDQFFDEAQFEAYRALGYHIAKEAFADAFRPDPGAGPGPEPVADRLGFLRVQQQWQREVSLRSGT